MFPFFDDLDLSRVERNLLESLTVIVLAMAFRWVVLRVVHRRIDNAEIWFRTRKWVTYAFTVVVAIVLVDIWLGGIEGALAWIGIISAGVAIALSDVLKNLAGWIYIVSRRPFKVGDRVEIDGISGDVVDIRVFRFTLLEIGNWVAADQSTGRLVHVPNGLIFLKPLMNFTEGFPLIWDEVPVLVTFESDWELAESLIRQTLEKHAPDPRERGMADVIRKAAQGYFIRYTHLDPTVYVSVEDSGVLLTGRYLVPVRERRGVSQDIWKGILRSFAQTPEVELAYPTVRTFLPDRLRLDHDTGDAAAP